MIKIEYKDESDGVYISVKGSVDKIALDFYAIFESMLSTKGLDNYFKEALFAYLECNEKLLNEFLKYHNDGTTKEVNNLVDKIFGDDDE